MNNETIFMLRKKANCGRGEKTLAVLGPQCAETTCGVDCVSFQETNPFVRMTHSVCDAWIMAS